MFAAADIMSGLILIGVLLLVPLCAAGVVLAMAWFHRDGDASPQDAAARPVGPSATPRGNESTLDASLLLDGQPRADVLSGDGHKLVGWVQ